MSDTDTNIDTDVIDLCSSLGEALDNDNYWCWQTNEADYSQILLILGLAYWMFLGSLLLTFASYINNGMSITAIKFPISSSRIPIPNLITNNNHNTQNMSIILDIINIVIHIIFFIIKLGILANTTYFSTVNQDFQELEFQQFMDANRILLVYLLMLSTALFWMNHIMFKTLEGKLFDDIGGSPEQILISFGYVLLVTDLVFTFIVLCIYYSLLVIILYLAAVAFIGLLMAMFIAICFSTLFVVCVTKLCVDCCIIIRRDDLEDVYIQFPNQIVQFMFLTFMIIVIGCLLFCINLWEYWCGWHFIGGPPDSFFYIDFNNNANAVRYWLFILSATFGISAVIGTLFSVLYSCANEAVINRGTHIQIGNH